MLFRRLFVVPILSLRHTGRKARTETDTQTHRERERERNRRKDKQTDREKRRREGKRKRERKTKPSKSECLEAQKTNNTSQKVRSLTHSLTPPSTSMHTLWHAMGPEATTLIFLGNDSSRFGHSTSPSVARRPSAVQSVPPMKSTVHGGFHMVHMRRKTQQGGGGHRGTEAQRKGCRK